MLERPATAGDGLPFRSRDIALDGADGTFGHIVDTVRLVMNVRNATVLVLPEGDGGMIESHHPLMALFAESIAADRLLTLGDVRQDPGCAGWDGLPADLRSVAAAPFRHTSGTRGMVIAIDDRPRQFGDRELAILAQFARSIVGELELHQRAFMRELQWLLDRYRRDGTPSVLSILDLDHFESINDRFGHQTGDHVLHVIAETFREVLGRDILQCRLGGEEVAVAFAGTMMCEAINDLERLRNAIAALHFGRHIPLAVTASLGVADLTPGLASVPGLVQDGRCGALRREAGRT